MSACHCLTHVPQWGRFASHFNLRFRHCLQAWLRRRAGRDVLVLPPAAAVVAVFGGAFGIEKGKTSGSGMQGVCVCRSRDQPRKVGGK